MKSPLAIVTGAAKRVGKHLALSLAEKGYDLLIHYHSSAEQAEAVAQEIRDLGQNAITVPANLQQPFEAAQTLFFHAKQLGAVELLINNASVFETGTLAETTPESFQHHQRVNLEAPLFLSQQFALQLPENTPGQIINLLDWRAATPPTGHLSYTLSKSGLRSLTQILAQELSPQIRVNGVVLGAILPPEGVGEEYQQRLNSNVPMQTHGSVDDVWNAVEFLLNSNFANGSLVEITGGEHL